MDKIPVVAVVGPTASGKTSLAIAIAKAFGGEVVSADSMQIYKGMDIATAKPSAEEQSGIVHHLIDFLPSDEKYSVADFVKDASECIADIHARGKLPVVAGGTGLYIDSLFTNTDFGYVPDNTEIRAGLKSRLEAEGPASLLEELRRVDPQSAERLHENNTGRVMRALEVYYLTGDTMTERLNASRLSESPYDVCYIGINYDDREKLYERINRRVDIMLEAGLEDEAARYIGLGEDTTARQAIGYKELKPYFEGKCTLDEAVESLKRETRRYAKRQLTWFRRNKDINWFYPDKDEAYGENAKNTVRQFLRERMNSNG